MPLTLTAPVEAGTTSAGGDATLLLSLLVALAAAVLGGLLMSLLLHHLGTGEVPATLPTAQRPGGGPAADGVHPCDPQGRLDEDRVIASGLALETCADVVGEVLRAQPGPAPRCGAASPPTSASGVPRGRD